MAPRSMAPRLPTLTGSGDAGKSAEIELVNHPNNWQWETAYWGEISIKSE